MKVSFFASAAGFRAWLKRHHESAVEIWVGFYRKDSGRKGITYAEALDEALCFGWIDGIRRRVDGASYTNRFTPRKARSIWSMVNTRRMNEQIALGRAMPAGIAAFERRSAERTGVYSFERERATFLATQRARFAREREAWRFFSTQSPSYRRVATWWVISAKREETRERRFDALIESSRAGKRLPQLTGKAAT